MLRDPESIALALLGASPDAVEPLVLWPDHATFRVALGKRDYLIKIDEDHGTVAREAAGYARAAAAGVRVPKLIARADDALVTTWSNGVPLNERPAVNAWRDTGAQLRIAHDVGAAPPFGAGFGGYEPAHASWRDFFQIFAERELKSCERDLGFPKAAAERIRAALRAAAPMLDTPIIGWCHGDCQPEHVLVDPTTDRVVAIIDWADHGSGDVIWDLMVLTFDDASHRDALLDGYEAGDELRNAFAARVPLFTVVRHLGEARWLAAHNLPCAPSLRRAIAWRP